MSHDFKNTHPVRWVEFVASVHDFYQTSFDETSVFVARVNMGRTLLCCRANFVVIVEVIVGVKTCSNKVETK